MRPGTGFRRHPGAFQGLQLMRVLVDTHAFLWWVDDAPALTRRARAVLANPANECWFSLVSCWESLCRSGLSPIRRHAHLVSAA
jgi:PIN domain nuclease of toxin-antitoxin system